MKLKIRDITILAILIVILFVQEEVLSFLPNISLTVFLIVLYAKKLGLYKTSLIVTIYCLLDNLFMNSFNIVYTPAMLIGWLLIPILLCLVFKKVNDSFGLAMLGILFSFIYCWLFILPSVIMFKISVWAYLASDVVFEIILAISSFVSILLLYNPCSKVFDSLLNKTS